MQRTMTPLSARILVLTGLGVVALVLALMALGQFRPLALWLQDQQRSVQDALAAAVRALRAGHPGAWAALMFACFSYGFLHAAGPGHGKAVIAGYGMARRVALAPLAGLALAGSLAQAAFAVVLVYAGVWVFDLGREHLEAVAEDVFLPLSYALVGAVGLWLVWRGTRRTLRTQGRMAAQDIELVQNHVHGHDGHGHAHSDTHTHDDACGCGHAHGPSLEQAAAVTSWRDAVVLVAAIAMRPCSGALFLLVLTFAMGIGWAGVAGAFVMGLGTAVVTVLSAALAFWAREGALIAVPGAGLARALPLIEVAVGAVIATVSLILMWSAI